VMSEINNLAGLSFKNDDHAAPKLCCRNCHDEKLNLRLK
jgi:hypothetical protein